MWTWMGELKGLGKATVIPFTSSTEAANQSQDPGEVRVSSRAHSQHTWGKCIHVHAQFIHAASPKMCATVGARSILQLIFVSGLSLLLCAFSLFKEGQCPHIKEKGRTSNPVGTFNHTNYSTKALVNSVRDSEKQSSTIHLGLTMCS